MLLLGYSETLDAMRRLGKQALAPLYLLEAEESVASSNRNCPMEGW